ncbi:facilitated trehalose transporter Tret1-2 homolog isoform X2 [Prorops nasuta]
MLSYHPENLDKTAKAKDISDDIENNNSDEKESCSIGHETPNTQYRLNSKGVFAQFMVTGAVFLLSAGVGMPIGYSAILLPQLSEINGTLRTDQELGSWIASVHSLATPVGSLLSGPLIETIGRRGSLQLGAIPLCVGWIVMGFAENISSILVGRVVSGLAVGLIAVPAQVLVGEIADPTIRGFLVGGSFAAYCFGILLVYAFGASFKWSTVAFCSIIFPGLALIALSLVHESPAWLVRRKNVEKARKALLWLRGGDVEQVEIEIVILQARARADNARHSEANTWRDKISSSLNLIFNRGVIKPFIIINIFNILQVSCGTYIVVFYAVDLINDIAGGNSIDSYLAALITGVIRAIFCIVGCALLLKIGRRLLGLLSASLTAVASLILAAYLMAKKEESPSDKYILGIFLLIYVAANTAGLFALPGIMIGELLPQRARGISAGFTFFIFNLFLFVVTKSFPTVNTAVGISGIFLIFGTAGIIEALFIYLAVPETKDRTLQEIEDYFQKDNFFWVTREKRPHEMFSSQS